MKTTLLLLLLCVPVDCATFTATTCSSSDVAAAISSASNGDTVVVPSGTCSWAAPVAVTKQITIQGQTTTSRNPSTFAVTPTDNTIIQTNGFSISATANVRITGFTFQMTGNGSNDVIGVPLTASSFRIDHNHFFKPDKTWGKSTGGGYLNILFDNNRVTDPSEETLYIVGAGNTSWVDGGACGSADASKATILEDNEFALVTRSTQGPIDSGEGGRFIIRFNLFSAAAGFEWQEVIEAHGHCYAQRDGFDNAGGYCQIIDDNKVQKGTAGNNGNILFKVRAGRSYVYNNQIFGTNWSDPNMVFYWIQEVNTNCNSTPCNIAAHATMTGEGLPHTVPLPTNWQCSTYPCPMQPNNSYIWGNTMQSGTFGAGVDDAPTSYMMENRDYWDDFNTAAFTKNVAASKPSTCTINDNYWTTDTNLLYRCTATNTWTLEYTAFTYPDPLQGISSGSSHSGPHTTAGPRTRKEF